METINFFGYGALRSRQVMTAILGHDPGEGKSAVVRGYVLAYQTLENIPEGVRPTLEKVWGKNFRAYTLREGQGGEVVGVIWHVSEADMQKLRAWEFVGSWRELVETKIGIGNETVAIQMIKASEGQGFEKIVDGLDYKININKEHETITDLIREEPDEKLMEQVHRQLEAMAGPRAFV